MSLVMYDSVDLSQVPADAPAVAGYVDGAWSTFWDSMKRFPMAQHLPIAVRPSDLAACLDVERSDATNADAPDWVRRAVAAGVYLPCLYTSVSNVAALLTTLKAAGIDRSQVRLWTAHYGHGEHLCSPACYPGMPTTADATQWQDRALGRNLDQSVCSDSFFAPAPVAPVVNPDGTKTVTDPSTGERFTVPGTATNVSFSFGGVHFTNSTD